MTPLLEIKNINKKFDEKQVITNFSTKIKENQFITLLGPSGCGKTTLLKIIGGFENPDSGEILFQGKKLLNVPSNKRDMCTVFQNYALFPHLNARDNIAYSLKIKRNKKSKFSLGKPLHTKKEINNKVSEILKIVGLEGHWNHAISQLSGGQQQRVAIARALISKPKLLLLDEPLGALDLSLRKEMQVELKRLQREFGITFIYVTHDQEEALTMSDHILVMKDGKILQQDSPINIYNEPVSNWVANFIGEGNHILGAQFIKDYLVHWDGNNFKCVDKGFEKNEVVDIVIRPEDIEIDQKSDNGIRGTIMDKIFKGVHWEVTVQTEKRNYLVHTTKNLNIGTETTISWDEDAIHVMKKNIS